MEYEIKDFIGRFTNAFDTRFCQDAIRYYEAMSKAGLAGSRQQFEGVRSTTKDTESLFISSTVKIGNDPQFSNYVMEVLWSTCYPIYKEKYGSLNTLEPQHVWEMKMQKTEIGGGYHAWHWESSGPATATRILNYQIFLNTVDEGGETEFLYLSRREQPVEGTLLIYPGSFTHTHRGNPPISNTKYIINGWIEF
jgi:hypothetical protein